MPTKFKRSAVLQLYNDVDVHAHDLVAELVRSIGDALDDAVEARDVAASGEDSDGSLVAVHDLHESFLQSMQRPVEALIPDPAVVYSGLLDHSPADPLAGPQRDHLLRTEGV